MGNESLHFIFRFFFFTFCLNFFLIKYNMLKTSFFKISYCCSITVVCFFFKKIYLFLEKGERGEKERERNINVWLPLSRPLLWTWPQPSHVP